MWSLPYECKVVYYKGVGINVTWLLEGWIKVVTAIAGIFAISLYIMGHDINYNFVMYINYMILLVSLVYFGLAYVFLIGEIEEEKQSETHK